MKSWLALWFVIVGIVPAVAADWPSRYRLVEGTESPDGHYGIIAWDGSNCPANNRNGRFEIEEEITYLADLRTRQVIGEIKDASYYWPHNHLYLSMTWVPGSKWCLAVYDDRWSFNSLNLLEIEGGEIAQHEIGSWIRQQCDKIADTEINCHFRLARNGLLQVVAFGSNNPTELDGVKERYVFFRGTYDGERGKWMTSKARSSSRAEYWGQEAFAAGYQTKGGTFSDRSEDLDAHLNDVYKALKRYLPEERFIGLRRQQRAWLNGAGKTGDVERETARVKARIRVLEDLLWATL